MVSVLFWNDACRFKLGLVNRAKRVGVCSEWSYHGPFVLDWHCWGFALLCGWLVKLLKGVLIHHFWIWALVLQVYVFFWSQGSFLFDWGQRVVIGLSFKVVFRALPHYIGRLTTFWISTFVSNQLLTLIKVLDVHLTLLIHSRITQEFSVLGLSWITCISHINWSQNVCWVLICILRLPQNSLRVSSHYSSLCFTWFLYIRAALRFHIRWTLANH